MPRPCFFRSDAAPFLFQESFVVFHHQLRLQLFVKLERHRYDDQDTGRGEHVHELFARKTECQRRYERDQRKEDRPEQRDTVGDLVQIIRRRLARTNTRNKPAVLLNALGYVFGIELDLCIKERERKDQQAQYDDVDPCPRPRAAADVLCVPAVGITAPEQTHDQIGQADDRKREDQRHNAAAGDLDRDNGGLSAVHFSALDLLCILNRDTAFRKVDRHDKSKDHDRDDAEDHDGNKRSRIETVGNHFFDRLDDDRNACRGNDTDKDDEQNAVADTVFGDTLAQPHGEHCACGVNDGHVDVHDPFVAFAAEQGYDLTADRTVIRKIDDNADRLHDGKDKREISGELRNFLLALFPLFGKPFERRDTDAEQLDDNGRVDVRPDTEREQRAACQRAARDGVHKSQEVVAVDHRFKLRAVQSRNRNVASEPVNKQQKKGDEDLLPDLFDFKCVL